MAYKFAKALVVRYIESQQSNPLRWEILHREDSENFTPQTGLMKCKDYFNDLVAAYKGVHFVIYGFSNKRVKLNTEGVWFRLSYLFNYEQFAKNINATLNTELAEEDKVTVEDLGNNQALLFIPVSLFSHTYKISLVSWIIRVCNNPIDLNSLEELYSSAPVKAGDFPIGQSGLSLARKWKFSVPDKYKEQWWFCGDTYNSEKNNHEAPFIHNNGVQNWANYAGV